MDGCSVTVLHYWIQSASSSFKLLITLWIHWFWAFFFLWLFPSFSLSLSLSSFMLFHFTFSLFLFISFLPFPSSPPLPFPLLLSPLLLPVNTVTLWSSVMFCSSELSLWSLEVCIQTRKVWPSSLLTVFLSGFPSPSSPAVTALWVSTCPAKRSP